MQRAVLLFVAVLSVAKASPFGLDSNDRPTPFRYTFRVEKVEFGDDAYPEDSVYNDNYYTDAFGEGAYYDDSVYFDSGEYNSGLSFGDLFGALDFCEDLDNDENPQIPEEGCIYLEGGNVHFINVLGTVDVDDVYKALEDTDIEECDMEDISSEDDLPEEGCFFIQEDINTVHFLGVYDDDVTEDVDELEDEFDEIAMCDPTTHELPEEPCMLVDENIVAFVNILNEDNIDSVVEKMAEIEVPECRTDLAVHIVTTTKLCYFIEEETHSLVIVNVDVDESEENEIDDDTPELPGADIVTPPSVLTKNGKYFLQKLKLKGSHNQQSSAENKAKAAFLKKIKSKQVQETRGNGRRRGQHGEPSPKWLRRIKTAV